MSTGTIQNAALQVVTDMRHDALQLGFTNDQGADLAPGDEVTLQTDDTVVLRDAGTELPVGIVVKGGADGERVTVRTYFTAVIKGIATGGAINSGVAVKPNGSKTNGVPQYVAVAAGDYANNIVIKGAAQDGEIVIGMLDSIHVVPA